MPRDRDSVDVRADILRFRKYEARAKLFDIEAGKNIIVLNEHEARENDIFTGDNVLVAKRGNGEKSEIVIVDTSKHLVKPGEAGLFIDSFRLLDARDGDLIEIRQVAQPAGIEFIRKKMDGKSLERNEIRTIIRETMEGRLAEIELASWISALYTRGMTNEETVYLTEAIVESGETLNLGRSPIVDKHCSGGVAGNRTTMIITPIIAAAGLYIPKTSSRAISSPAGTADTMEVLAPVEFGLDEMREIVLKTNGCIVWGGAINLAAADDKLIRIRHPLRLDPKGVLLASILAKKKSVGAQYVVIDIPVGRGSKHEDVGEARALARDFIEIGSKLGMRMECLLTDGSDPVGERIGPALECYDVLNVLQNRGPLDLTEKSCQLAGALLELCGKARRGRGREIAYELLRSGKAYAKMKEIISAQGGDPDMRIDDLPIGRFTHKVAADREGRVEHIDNKTVSKIARAAGAPRDRGAGVILHCSHGDRVRPGDVLFEIVAESEPKLSFALQTLDEWEAVELQKVVIGKVGGR